MRNTFQRAPWSSRMAYKLFNGSGDGPNNSGGTFIFLLFIVLVAMIAHC